MGLVALICTIPPWYHLGRLIVERLVPGIGPDLRDGLSIGIGFAVLSYIVMLLAALGGLAPVFLWLLIVIPFLLTLPLTLKRLRAVPTRWRSWSAEFPLSADRLLWTLIGFLVLCDLISCGNAAVGWDAAVHHYAFPKALLNAGRLIDTPEITFSYYPSLGEMLFTLGLGSAGEFLAGALTWVYLFPLAWGFLALGRRLGGARIGLWAIVLFLGAPLTFETPFSGVIDLPFFVYCLLAIAVFLDRDGVPSWRRIVLIGFLIGCAAATKHLGLLFLVAFVPVMVWLIAAESRRASMAIAAALGVIALALIIPLPWHLRSCFATGDPLFPFLGNLLHPAGQPVGGFSIESFARTDYPRTLAGFLIYLWHLTMEYWDHRPWYLAIHPAYLAFLPPALVWTFLPAKNEGRRQSMTTLIYLLALALLTMLINFDLAPAYPRYLFPTWICLALVSAWTLSEIQRVWPPLGRILLPLSLVLPLLVVLGMGAKRAVEVVPQYWSADAREAAVHDTFPGYGAFLWANENLDPARTRILSIDPKVYYLESPAIIAKPGIESPLIVPWDSSPGEIIANWRELGVTHFILDTTLLSVKHGFGIDFFTSVLGDRDKVWLDIVTTRQGADLYGIGDILTDEEFHHMSALAELPIVNDGTIDRHLLTRERLELFQSWGRDWQMAHTLLQFISAGILVERFRSGPGGGLRIYSVHLPMTDEAQLHHLPDVTEWCLPFEEGPTADPPG